MVQRPRANNVYELLARPFSPYQGESFQSSTSSHPLAGQFGHQYHTPEYNLTFGLSISPVASYFGRPSRPTLKLMMCKVVPRERSFNSRSCDHTVSDVRTRESKCWWTFLSHRPTVSCPAGSQISTQILTNYTCSADSLGLLLSSSYNLN